ncbi:MAG: DUF3466 family protein [Chloroflexi bacterium]|nr:MAG: DUF3466 family protein [Chloroflexota bacterium]
MKFGHAHGWLARLAVIVVAGTATVVGGSGSARGNSLAAAAEPEYTLTDLGAVTAQPRSEAKAINNKGIVVGDSFNSTGPDSAIVWRPGATGSYSSTALPNLAGGSIANDVNDKGAIVGVSGQTIPQGERAVIWDATGVHDLNVTVPAGSPGSVARGINAKGQIVGDIGGAGGGGFQWDAGTVTPLGQSLFPTAINAAGEIVGRHETLCCSFAFHVLFAGAVPVDLPTFGPSSPTGALDANDSGDIVGASGRRHGTPPFAYFVPTAAFWHGDAITNLGTLAGCDCESSALAINNAGTIVGYSDGPDSDPYFHAVIWKNSSIHDLNDLIPANSGLLLERASGINDKGQIVGTGYRLPVTGDPRFDEEHAYLLVPAGCDPIDEAALADPASIDSLPDRDGDAIPDCWEEHGASIRASDGTVVTYPIPGADPDRADVYVEVDWMTGHRPQVGSLPDVVAAFSVDGGITLHARPDEEVPDIPFILFRPGTRGSGAQDDFWDLKVGDGAACHGYFGTVAERSDPHCGALLAAKRLFTRYAIFGDHQFDSPGSSGVSEIYGNFGGNDLMVTLGGWSASSILLAGGQEAAEAGTFMHELGHTLGLDHGGDEARNCKPNYPSVMNYLFQFPYPHGDPNRPLDYSHGARPSLNEAGLAESLGLGGVRGGIAVFGNHGIPWTEPADGAIDWNEDGTIGNSSADINRVDTIGDCAYPFEAVDGSVISASFGALLSPTSVPAPSAFSILVNGMSNQQPRHVAVYWNFVYVSLDRPVAATDSVTWGYTRPAQNPLTLLNGTVRTSWSSRTLVNRTGVRETLDDYNDWGHLVFRFRDGPGFASGAGQLAHPDVPDMTVDEVAATAGAFPRPDATAPDTTAMLSPAPNAAGWNQGMVTVALGSMDEPGGSGVREIVYRLGSNAPVTVAGDSASVEVSAEGTSVLAFYARDNAGNAETEHTITVRIDNHAPNIACGAADSAWHAANVSIACAAADSLSGLAQPTDATLTLATSVRDGVETADASTGTHAVCDVAGNCATAGPVRGNRVDRKSPTITVSVPFDDATYVLNEVARVAYTCDDGGSGIASCAGSSARGAPLDTSRIGVATFNVVATDAVGNRTTQAAAYLVGYRICPLFDLDQSKKAGSTVPVRLQLCDAAGANASSLAIAVTALAVDGAAPADSGTANPGNTFRFEADLGGSGGYVYNLSTRGLAPGRHTLTLQAAGDAMIHRIDFLLR